MEGIKTCMLNMKKEREKANDKADAIDEILKVATVRLKKVEKEHAELTEFCTKLEYDYNECLVEFKKADKLVDQKERAVCKTQIEGNNRMRKLQDVDVEQEASENNLKATLDKLDKVNRLLDESGRITRVLTNRAASDKLRFKELEKQVKELSTKTEEAEYKIEENSEIISIFEEDLDSAENRAHNAEQKLVTIREELAVVGNNLKSLEVSAEQSRQQEIEFNKTIQDLTAALKRMEHRAAQGEQHVQRLLAEIDKLSGDMKKEKEKMRGLSFEMEATLSEFK